MNKNKNNINNIALIIMSQERRQEKKVDQVDNYTIVVGE